MKSLVELLNESLYGEINENKQVRSGKLLLPKYPKLTKKQKDYLYDNYDQPVPKTDQNVVLNVPAGKWFVYFDMYHQQYHIATAADIYQQALVWWEDFEDYSPKNIIAGFETLKECVEWCLKESGCPVTDPDDVYEWVATVEHHYTRRPSGKLIKGKWALADNADFIMNVLNGDVDENEEIYKFGDPSKLTFDKMSKEMEWFNYIDVEDEFKKK